MKKFVTVITSLVLSVVYVLPASALEANGRVLSGAQIQLIASKCNQSRAALQQVHSYDALTRVNLGQRYENISNRLMAPMVSRLVLNDIDAVEVNATMVEYKKQIKNFAQSYRNYEASLQATIDTDCDNNPVAYYQNITDARTKRVELRVEVEKADGLIRGFLEKLEEATTSIEDQTS